MIAINGRPIPTEKADSMITLKSILLPTDFSEPSAVAVRYAKALTETFRATLHVLHVVEETALVYPLFGHEGAYPSMPILREDLEKDARARLEKILTSGEREQWLAQLVVRIGSPFVEIVRYAKNENIDLIVMGTHGRGPIAHMLMGSVAERVVRKAPCPVLTVRHPEHEFVLP
jgi:nucleotide-binding universal stress UspA family protein